MALHLAGFLPISWQIFDRVTRKAEGGISSSLLSSPLSATARAVLGYPFAKLLENAKETFVMPHSSLPLPRARYVSSRGDPGEPSPVLLGTLAGLCLVEHAGKGILISHTRTAEEGDGCWDWCALKPSCGATAPLPRQGKGGCSEPVLWSAAVVIMRLNIFLLYICSCASLHVCFTDFTGTGPA